MVQLAFHHVAKFVLAFWQLVDYDDVIGVDDFLRLMMTIMIINHDLVLDQPKMKRIMYERENFIYLFST